MKYALDGVRLSGGEYCIAPSAVVMGTPGKIVRAATGADHAMIAETVDFHVGNQARFRAGLTPDES